MISVQQTRDRILEAALPEAAIRGWVWADILAQARQAGLGDHTVRAVFPNKLPELLSHFSDWADRKMLEDLAVLDANGLKVKERIRAGVATRLAVLEPHKAAFSHALSYWSLPLRQAAAARLVWSTADRIWCWAGDTATDYNRYTKRALLSGIIGTTTLVWINDHDKASTQTLAFLDRRIENVLSLGRFLGRFKKSG